MQKQSSFDNLIPDENKMHINLPTITPFTFNSFVVSTDNIHSDFYNNYMFEIGKNITFHNDIDLVKFNFPKRISHNITKQNNKFTVNVNDTNQLIEIPEKYYNREELIKTINDHLPPSVRINLSNWNKISFESENKFMLIEESLLFLLGFKKHSYVGKNMYEAEKEINIGDNVFLISIENICETPLFVVNLDDNVCNKIHGAIMTLNETDYLQIKIHVENNLNNEFFFREPHKMEFIAF